MKNPSTKRLKIAEALGLLCETTGHELSVAAIAAMVDDLERYPSRWLAGAFRRCRREMTGRFSLADVIKRLEDGRPGPEEAWALIPTTEAASCVWTDDMREAYAAARPLIAAGDTIAARMAFKEVYEKRCSLARQEGVPSRWTPSLGHDPLDRERVLREAVELGRIEAAHANALLPAPQTFATPQVAQLLTDARARLLAPPAADVHAPT